MDSYPLKQVCGVLMMAWVVAGATSYASGAAANLSILASFARLNGSQPYGALLQTADGNFYGTTSEGGTNGLPFGLGTVFRIGPTGTLTTLVSFDNAQGAKPYAALALGPDGSLYGTTLQGGISNAGTIFRVTTNGSFNSMISFDTGNGSKPFSRLTLGRDGHFYGTTQSGGASNEGTVFRFTTNGMLTTLVSFSETNGANPYAEVIEGTDGHYYGTTVNGGSTDFGTVFRVTTNGALTTLFSFDDTNGANPYGGLVQDTDGILYGTTTYGGPNGYGTIFRITTNGALTTLHSFTGGNDGANPWASLLRGTDGTVYGTAILGGSPTAAGAWGTVFQTMSSGSLAVIKSFDFSTNGISPYASLIQDSAGNLYGTTYRGGAGLYGTVFRLTPSPQTLRGSVQPGNTFRLTWDVWLGKTYQVQSITNVTHPNWVDFGNAFVATNSPATVDAAASGPSRLYRVQLNASP